MNKPIFLILAIVSLIFAGCSNGENIETENHRDTMKDELILALGNEPETGFDPALGWGQYGSPLFQSTLLKRDNDLNVTYDAATHYEVSEDGKVWTVKLRDDVLFSDGKPLTAEDVQFSFETALTSNSVLDLNILEKVVVKDPTSVEFHLHQANSTFIHSLLTLGIIPKHSYGDDYAESPIGSGPYKLVQWDKGQQIIIEMNPEYYGKVPFFKRITFLFLNEDAAFAAAKAGQVDLAYIPASFSKNQVPGMVLHEIQSVDNRGVMFPYVPSGEKTKDGYDIGNDVTADIAIRKAINLAIDRQALVDGILEGHGTPGYSASDGLPWANEETKFNDGDLKKAKEILSSAGWKDQDDDGNLEKGNLQAEVNLLYPANDVTRQSLAIAVSDMVKPLGIQINVEGKSWDEIEKLMHSNAVMMGWGSHDPIEIYNLFSGSMAGMDYYNSGYYSNPKVDEYLEKALGSKSEDEAIEYWKKAQWDGSTGFSFLGDAPWAWLVNINHLYLVNEKLDIGEQRIQPHGHGWPITDNLVDWKWDEK
ncbi:ABC transporter substrate-binding protein [Neobacillus niacini]|uniref:ABC transporter substrate-binding protein n=1 Tax=Neobacillus niacini TaxID=86668 RepID=UPI0039836AC7